MGEGEGRGDGESEGGEGGESEISKDWVILGEKERRGRKGKWLSV